MELVVRGERAARLACCGSLDPEWALFNLRTLHPSRLE
jgi:hypothetical protein